MNADEFASEVGLTVRTVRSYHARGLLPPPVRIGRAPHYLRDHLTRMRHVLRLQRRGLSLDAVRTLLEPDLVLGQVLPVGRAVADAVRGRPALLAELVDDGIVIRRADGDIEVRAVRAVLAAVAAGGRETPMTFALNLLAEIASGVATHADAALKVVERATSCLPLGYCPNADELADLAVEVFRARIRRIVRQGGAAIAVPEHLS